MSSMDKFRTRNQIAYHKGFYNADNLLDGLYEVLYQDFFDVPEDEEFPYTQAEHLLKGSCHLFAMALNKIFGYTPYIIEPKHKRGVHAFCQIYKSGQWYYVDARGITTSFDEFMGDIKIFVNNEYMIRPIEQSDIDKCSENDDYAKEGYAFAEAIINKYKSFYEL